MAAMFYARYVPPTNTKPAGLSAAEAAGNALKPSKKRKRGGESTSNIRTEVLDVDPNQIKSLASDKNRLGTSWSGEAVQKSISVLGDQATEPIETAVEARDTYTSNENLDYAKKKKRQKKTRRHEEYNIRPKEKRAGEEPKETTSQAQKKDKDKNASSTPKLSAISDQPELIAVEAKHKKKKLTNAVEISEIETDMDQKRSSLQHGKPQGNESDLEEVTKHKSIRTKYERSSKIAAKLSENSKAAGEDEVVEGDPNQEPSEKHGLVPLPQPPEVPDILGSNISVLPEWITKPVVVTAIDTHPFEDLSLSPSVVESLAAKGYRQAFAIQSAVLPMLLPGLGRYNGDICISAATGSGKTIAYVLPMVEALRGKPVTRLRGLVVVPTRELVTQVRETLELCIAGSGLKIGTAVGNNNLKDEQGLLMERDQVYDPESYQRAQVKRITEKVDIMNWDDEFDDNGDESERLIDFTVGYTSRVDILVCTPGRLVEHLKATKGFTLEHVQWLIIDEADRLLDQSFQQWIEIVLPTLQAPPKQDHQVEILQDLYHIQSSRHVQKIVLSATMTRDLSKLMALNLRKPALVVLETTGSKVEIEDPGSLLSTIELPQTLKETTVSIKQAEDKPLYLLHLLGAMDFIASINFSTPNLQHGPSQDDDQLTSSSEDESSTSYSGASVKSSDISDSDEDETSPSSSNNDSDSANASPPTKRSNPSIVQPETYATPVHGVLIFTNNNENALRLTRLLCLLRPSWAKHIGSLTKSTATSSGRKTLHAFRKQKISILIASDRASRGLDIQNLAQVINYDMPTSLTSYVHRIGRTARAGREGTATTLVAHHEARWFWNQIAKSKTIHRGAKISRLEWSGYSVSNSDREAYEVALKKLGQEARGLDG